MSEICERSREKLNSVGLHFSAMSKLTSQTKIDAYTEEIETTLDSIGQDILELDDVIGRLSATLNQLQIAHTINTGAAFSSTNALKRRYELFKKRVAYYCHVRMVLIHQIEAQKLANDLQELGVEMSDDGSDSGSDDELKQKAMLAGPHVSRMLRNLAI
jgi:hypothetical protein